MGLSGAPARIKSTPEPPGGSKTSTGSIDRDLGTSGGALGGFENNECIEDRGLGRFLGASWTPKSFQNTSKELRGSFFGASWEFLGALIGGSWGVLGGSWAVLGCPWGVLAVPGGAVGWRFPSF